MISLTRDYLHNRQPDRGHHRTVIAGRTRAVIAAGYRLTAREAQTMTLLLRGLPTKTIAKALRVTMNTANDHIKASFAKTGVSSHGELMAAVFQDHSAPGS